MIDPKQDDLSAFADWYLREGPRHIKPPAQDTMMHVEGLTGLCVYRNPPFQVELFLVRPNVFIPQHIHPNVDSYEVFLYGMEFVVDTQVVIPYEDRLNPAWYHHTFRILPNCYHGGRSGPEGGAFMSIQHWLNDTVPTHVGDDWAGNTMGKNHNRYIEEKSNGNS